MAKQKTITEQIEEMQEANKKLSDYEKIFDKLCQINFGISAKSIQKMTEEHSENCSDFEKKICNYFGLKTSADKNSFLSIMCSDSSKNFFNSKRENGSVETAEQE